MLRNNEVTKISRLVVPLDGSNDGKPKGLFLGSYLYQMMDLNWVFLMFILMGISMECLRDPQREYHLYPITVNHWDLMKA